MALCFRRQDSSNICYLRSHAFVSKNVITFLYLNRLPSHLLRLNLFLISSNVFCSCRCDMFYSFLNSPSALRVSYISALPLFQMPSEKIKSFPDAPNIYYFFWPSSPFFQSFLISNIWWSWVFFPRSFQDLESCLSLCDNLKCSRNCYLFSLQTKIIFPDMVLHVIILLPLHLLSKQVIVTTHRVNTAWFIRYLGKVRLKPLLHVG